MPAACPDYIENLKQHLEQNPERSLPVDEMSRLTHISRYHLIRSFRKEVGLTPHRFQIQNRVRKAQRLLSQSLSMTEAALASGFFDQSHFIRSFEKIVGLTPSCYKSAYQLIRIQ